jgi:hypothetical protein
MPIRTHLQNIDLSAIANGSFRGLFESAPDAFLIIDYESEAALMFSPTQAVWEAEPRGHPDRGPAPHGRELHCQALLYRRTG